MTLPLTRRVKDSRVFSSSLSALEVEVFAVSLHLSRRRRARRRARRRRRRRRLAFFSFSWKKSDMKRQDRCLVFATPHRVTKSVKKHRNKNVTLQCEGNWIA